MNFGELIDATNNAARETPIVVHGTDGVEYELGAVALELDNEGAESEPSHVRKHVKLSVTPK